uniref:uncharacterized protein LOC120342534 n=1 Tax=Styela clava TaxID=7725 RepID=UPI00193A1DE3|nr:uncharacterized protein LOC120342534 [Styela clava]
MNYLKLFILVVLLATVTAKKARRKKRIDIEIVSKNSTSFVARFPQYKRVKAFFVSISVKFLADAPSDYVADFVKSDMEEGGYYEINAANSLQPGSLYELVIYNKKKFSALRSMDFYTDCDAYSFQCMNGRGKGAYQACLEKTSLCDGTADCRKGEDEVKNEDGHVPSLCLTGQLFLLHPHRADAPCILAHEKAIRESTTPLPECDENGLFSAMKCEDEGLFTCYCLHPETGEILATQPDFSPFVHWDFSDNCQKLREEAPKDKTA